MSDGLRIRRATPADADAIATTVSAGFETYRAFAPEGWRPPDTIELGLGVVVRLRLPTLRGWVAETEDGKPAGHVTYVPAADSRMGSDDPSLAHLEQLFVRPAHFGSGVASKLLAVAVCDAAASGFEQIRLGTPRDHHRARRFYEREGWTTDERPLPEDSMGLVLILYRRALAGSGSRATA
ncbi:MAG TPA: GNAT family N-acetyltransferase [Solirubrobacteraceae bacterium]|nr:GNAT family N-acetyltransferase [Solirubrobacteraceae bacterium]